MPPSILAAQQIPADECATDDEVMNKTLEMMKSRNVIGVTSGPRVVCWREAALERVIPSLSFGGGAHAPSVDEMRRSFEGGQFAGDTHGVGSQLIGTDGDIRATTSAQRCLGRGGSL